MATNKVLANYSMEDVNAHFQNRDGMAKFLKLRIVELTESFCALQMPLLDEHRNGLNTAHGGVVFSIADITFGAATFGAGFVCVTAQSSFSFLSAGKEGPLRAEANLIKNGRHLMVYSVSVYDTHKNLLGQGQFTGYKVGTVDELFPEGKLGKPIN